jgi:hypothetical protein
MAKKKAKKPAPRSAAQKQEFIKMVDSKYGKALDFNDAPDEMKLSAKLIDLVEPFSDDLANLHDYTILYDCAAIAWNACLKEDQGITTKYQATNVLLNFANYQDWIDTLKERKRTMFPHDYRGVRETRITDDNGDPHLDVVSDMNLEAMFSRLVKMASEEP